MPKTAGLFIFLSVLIPYGVTVYNPRHPWMNWVLVGANVLIYLGVVSRQIPEEAVESMILDGWKISGLFGCFFLHFDFTHLVGNLLFLWAFGNAVCARLGNLTYLAIYLLCGLMASMVHLWVDGAPAIGASGAINGVVALFLILYPKNDVSCLWYFMIRGGTFDLQGYWLILLWLVLDVFGAVAGHGSNIAYWAHLGGFFTGATVGIVLLFLRKVEFDHLDTPHLLWIFFPKQFAVDEPKKQEVVPPVYSDPTFYLYSQDQQMGPFPMTVIHQLLQMNQISHQDLIFDPELSEWRPLEQFLSN